MHTIRRKIPRSSEAVAALRGDRRSTRSGTPTWLAAAAAAGLAAQLDTSIAHADPGSVQLRNGGRVRGDLVAVLPNERVVVMLPDGTSMTIAWTDVQFVFDGNRVFDSAGNVATLEVETPPPPPSPPPATTTPSHAGLDDPPPFFGAPAGAPGAPLYLRTVQSDREAYDQYARLPRRGGSVSLLTFGSLLVAEGVLNVTFGSMISGYSSYGGDASQPMLIAGSLSLGLGALMIGLGIRNTRRRNEGIEQLRLRGFLVAGLHDSLALGFDAQVGEHTFVPRLTLRF